MSEIFDPFAELNNIQRTECRNSIAYSELAKTACEVYLRSLSLPTYVLQEVDLSFWTDVAAKAAQIIDLPESEQGTLEISAKALAKALYTQYCLSTDTVPHWDEVPANYKIAWEAVGRHLANLIDSDGQTPNFPELEERIIEWAKQRATSPQLSLS
jgi:hypothetical protein